MNIQDIKDYLKQSLERCIEGEACPLELFAELNELHKFIKDYDKKTGLFYTLLPLALKELKGEKEVTKKGIKFEYSLGGTYKYKNLSYYAQIAKEQKILEAKMQALYKLYKAGAGGKELDQTWADENGIQLVDGQYFCTETGLELIPAEYKEWPSPTVKVSILKTKDV
jgi:hypothetical protein